LAEHTVDSVGDVEILDQAGQYPRCPFTRLGLDAEGMSHCPGFLPETRGVTEIEPWEVEFGITQGVTCHHLGVQERAEGGFISACQYPGGPPEVGMPTPLTLGRRMPADLPVHPRAHR
jgi:hypothetical protein